MIWFDIIIFAAVAAFLGWRLYGVLGQRNGSEREHGSPFEMPKPRDNPVESTPAGMAGPVVGDAPPPSRPRPVGAPDSLGGRLELIGQSDPSFNEKNFLNGARGAFEAIVGAFAAEDTAALRPLLSDDVYDSFASAIRTRKSAGHKLETRVVRIKDAEIVDAAINVNTARVTVRFVTEQIQMTKDASGTIIEGDNNTREIKDRWTFTRNTRALDPNWHLAETRAED